jgi:hypothetical protein
MSAAHPLKGLAARGNGAFPPPKTGVRHWCERPGERQESETTKPAMR